MTAAVGSADEAAGAGARLPVIRPGVFGDDFARHLQLSKRRLLALSGTASTIFQTGAAYLDQPLPVRLIGSSLGEPPEPVIETFVVDHDGRCTGTGSDPDLIEAWLPAVTTMVRLVLDAVGRRKVILDGPAYLTASLTPIDQVATTAHFDDDQYIEGDGVGLVAIAASHDGARVACEPIAHQPVSPPLPLRPADGLLDRFTAGAIAHHQAEADRIIVFPQFGQLHAGPVTGRPTSHPIRSLLVMRARTRPLDPA